MGDVLSEWFWRPNYAVHGVTQCVKGWQQTERLSEGAISAVTLPSITIIPLSLGVPPK